MYMTSTATSTRRHVSHKASRFTESVIREMTREALKHGAVNLSQSEILNLKQTYTILKKQN